MNISTALIFLSLIMVSLGGLSDLTGKRFIISKEHYWHDGLYCLVLAIAMKVMYNN